VIELSSAKFALLSISILASFFHWIGILLTGIVIGAISKNFKQALSYALIFAVLFWLAFLAYSGVFGAIEKVLGLPLTFMSLALTVILAASSSLITRYLKAAKG
jgi:hypothetical protein